MYLLYCTVPTSTARITITAIVTDTTFTTPTTNDHYKNLPGKLAIHTNQELMNIQQETD